MSGRCRTIFFEQALKQFHGARQQRGTGFRYDFFAGSRIMALVCRGLSVFFRLSVPVDAF